MKRLTEKKQTNIMNYFKTQENKKNYDTSKMSVRVQKAVKKMTGVNEQEEENELKKSKKSTSKGKNLKTNEDIIIINDEEDNKLEATVEKEVVADSLRNVSEKVIFPQFK